MRILVVASLAAWVILIGLVAGAHAAPGDSTPAFPGAEGFGAAASGGRGKPVHYVTNLDDDGPGSLRDAISESDRTILFHVSGTILLKSPLRIEGSNMTIAGQTAPGDGICLRGKEIIVSGDNVILRFMRLRPGNERGEEHDALTIWGGDRIMIDHCSMSWSTDSVNDVVRDSTNVSVQWCILSEPLNRSVHHKGAHGYGTGWGSGRSSGNSYHHNLIAHCNSRSPRVGSEEGALVDVRNNVIYNMGEGWAYGGEHARVNFVANYYKPGPSTLRPEAIFRLSSPDTRLFLQANVVAGNSLATEDNASALIVDSGVDLDKIIVRGPFAVAAVDTQPADQAYDLVLRLAGAMLPQRDAVDERVLADVRHGTGRVINSQDDVGGWPPLASTSPPEDADTDGMPDEWERSHGLDPQDAADGQAIQPDGYSHLEAYLNHLAASAMPAASIRP